MDTIKVTQAKYSLVSFVLDAFCYMNVLGLLYEMLRSAKVKETKTTWKVNLL